MKEKIEQIINNYESGHYSVTGAADKILNLFDNYASQKWEQACQLQINNCLNNLTPELQDTFAYGDIASAPKPDYIP